MFDFVATLEAADRCVAVGDFAMATFNYWLIGYAVRHEEDMANYSIEIEEEAAEKFLKYAYEHQDEILTAESYLSPIPLKRLFLTLSVMTPLEVDRIAIPSPPRTLGTLSAFA